MDIIKTPVDIKTLIQTSNIEIYNKNRLIEKLQTHFSEIEQRQYVCNLFLYLNYHPTNDFIVNLDNVWKFIGFSNKANAKRLLKHNFNEEKDYKLIFIRTDENKNKDKNTVIQTDDGHINKTLLIQTNEQKNNKDTRGRKEETIMLNINTFKKLCLKANTENADKIHDYYIKLEMIYNELMKEELKEQKQQLEGCQQQLQNKDKLLENNAELNKHNILLKEYSNNLYSLIYIIKVKTLNENQYIIKLGESRQGIFNRYQEHKLHYDECVLLDCFLVKRSKDFEKFLHSKLFKYKYTKLQCHEKENELFLVGKELSYLYIIDIIKNNIKQFDDNLTEINSLKLQIEKLKIELELKNNYQDNTQVKNELVNLKEYIKEEFKQLNIKLSLKSDNNFGEPYHANGKKIQQINPETLQLIKVYNNVQEVSKIFNIPRSSLVKAINENLICKMFRWCYVNDIYENKVDIQPTRQLKKVQNNGYIAKLNNNKSEILNVYLDRKTACLKENYNSIAFLDNYVKCGKPVGEYYYVLYDSLDKDIKEKFLIKNNISILILYKNGVGKFDSEHNLIEEFKSKDDCIKNSEIGQKSLVKALEKGVQYNNHYYKYLNSKLFI